MNIDILPKFVVMALLLESIVQTIKMVWQPEVRTVVNYVNLAIGLILSILINFLAGLDLFEAVGIPLVKAPWVGVIFTGLILSRGSNVIHDLLKAVMSVSQSLTNRLTATPKP